MTDQATQVRKLTVELPTDAPLIRITAGMGSAGQKTWNLRRPVTVIGSRRPAHIILHDEHMSNAHCVIVNTGTEVLLKDLHTSSGTQLNKSRVNLALLTDGDVITFGDTTIQVAIQVPDGASDDSGFDMKFTDPTKFPGPVSLQLIHTDKQWSIDDAVVLIGRHDDATVRLDHADMSSRHALLFRAGSRPAIFDLGSRTGVWVNGQRCSLSPLQAEDRITVGTFGLSLKCRESNSDTQLDRPVVGPVAGVLTPSLVDGVYSFAPKALPIETPIPAVEADRQHAKAEPALGKLCGTFSDDEKRLNLRQVQLRDGVSAIDEQKPNLPAREAEVDAKDAAHRGQLHDISRLHQQITIRESELAANIAELQAAADALAKVRKACNQRESDITRREQEISRRENAVAQRWSRLSVTTCPHCRKPLNVGNVSFDPN